VEGQLVEDEVELEPVVCIPWLDDALEPWFTWKQGLRERHGLRFGLDYTFESGDLWRGGRDSNLQPPAVTPRKRRGSDD
jgi:hypothetical protein